MDGSSVRSTVSVRDARLAGVGGGQGFPATAGRDDLRARVLGGEGDRAGEPAAAPDDEHGLVLQ